MKTVIRSGLVLSLPLVMMACGDLLYQDPSEAGPAAVVSLSIQNPAQLQGVDPGVASAFGRINQLHLTVAGGEEPVSETFAVSGQSGELRAAVEVPIQGGSAQASIQVELRGGGGALFVGEGRATLVPGRTARPEIELASVVGGVSLEPATPPSLTFLGETFQLQAQALFRTGDPIPGVDFVWSSADPAVASVSSAGVVTAVGPGVAQIRAQGGGEEGSVPMAVSPLPASIELEPTLVELSAGKEAALEAAVRDAGGSLIDAEVEWSTADPAIAVITAPGRVQAQAPGETVVQARVGNVSAQATIRVIGLPPIVEMGVPSAIESDRATLEGRVNPLGLLTEAWFEWGRDPGLSDAGTSPRVDVGAGRSFVDVIRQITGLDEGTSYYVRLVAENEVGTSRGDILSFRTPLTPVDRIDVDLESVVLPPGGSVQLRAVAVSGDGVPLDRTLLWRSTDTEVATVTEDGLVTAGEEGSAVIEVSIDAVVVEIPVEVRGDLVEPEARTLPAQGVGLGEAVLRGEVDPGGAQTEVRFHMGRNPALAEFEILTPATGASLSPSTGFTTVQVPVGGLSEGTRYYFRVVASSAVGESRGAILSFETGVDLPTPILEEVRFEILGDRVLTRVTFSGYDPDRYPDADFFLEARRSDNPNWTGSQRVGPFTAEDQSGLDDLNVDPGIAYDFRLQARRLGRLSAYSNVVSTVPPVPQAPRPTIEQFFPAIHSEDLREVVVSALIQDAGWEAEYWFEFARNRQISPTTNPQNNPVIGSTPLRTVDRQGHPSGSMDPSASLAHRVEEVVGAGDSWLTEGKTVYYRPLVRIPGDPDSVDRSATVFSFTYGRPINPPGPLTASFGAGGITVTGAAPFTSSAGFLEVQRRVNGGAWETRSFLEDFPRDIRYIDADVPGGGEYQYRIRGCRPDGGCSFFTESNPVQF